MNLSTVRRCRSITLTMGLAVVLAGCGKGVSQSNYDKINNGMSQADVEGLLGTDKEKTNESAGIAGIASGKVLTWTDGSKTITVTFVNDKVTTKSQTGL